MAQIQCFGHYGGGRNAYDDSFDSIRSALAYGVDWIHVNAAMLNDKAVILWDNAFSVFSKKENFTRERTWNTVSPMGADSFFRPAPLEEIIKEINGRSRLNIEIHGAGFASPVVREIHKAVFSGKWNYKQVLVSSNDLMELQMVQCYDPSIRVGCVFSKSAENMPEFAEKMGAYSLHLDKLFFSADMVDECHSRGLKVIVANINSEDEYLLMEVMGVDGVVSDYPERIITWRFMKNAPDSLLLKS